MNIKQNNQNTQQNKTMVKENIQYSIVFNPYFHQLLHGIHISAFGL